MRFVHFVEPLELQIAGACRFVWNRFLAANGQEYRDWKDGKRDAPPEVTYFSLGKEFTELRRETPWLQELPANVVKYSLKRLSDALREFLKGQKGYPKSRRDISSSPASRSPRTSVSGRARYISPRRDG